MTVILPERATVVHLLKALLLGQILAVCNTGTGVTSQILTDKIKVSSMYICSKKYYMHVP